MPEAKNARRNGGILADKSWLKGTNLYFVEYGLLLLLLTLVLWLFDSLVFNIFGSIAGTTDNIVGDLAGASAVAGTFVLVPALYVVWRRVRSEERKRPDIWLRQSHRFPLYAFVLLQVISALFVAYLLVLGVVTAIISGFSGFGLALLSTVLPGLVALAVHAFAAVVFLGNMPRKERSFINALVLGMLLAAFVLLLVLAVNDNRGPQVIDQRNPSYDGNQDYFQDYYQDDRQRQRNFFDY